MVGERRAYASAGVDVEAGERAVALMRDAVESTRRPEVVGGIGGFAAAVAIPEGYREPLLVSSTDGVGTKTAIAAALGRFDTIGFDLVAMCADDVVCSGAEPLFFLDYVAVGRLDPIGVAELVGSIAAGCREAGCALVGGETAEHPGILEVGEFDLAGCCVGVVERERLIDGSAVRAGDVLLGLASSGLHANGFSLVRALVAQWDLDLGRPYQEQLRLTLGESGAARAILALCDIVAVHGIAHVTGGGLAGNVPRILPEGLAAQVDPSRWRMPSVMRLFGALGGVEDDELRATFNGGIGMVVAVDPAAAEPAIRALAGRGIAATTIGEVVPAGALDGRTYAEAAQA